MLSKLILKAGSTLSQPNFELGLSQITVFIGPNNGGKSIALGEIEQFIVAATNSTPENLIVENIEFEPWASNDMLKELERLKVDPKHTKTGPKIAPTSFSGQSVDDQITLRRISPLPQPIPSITIDKSQLMAASINPNTKSNKEVFKKFIALLTLKLDGVNRLNLVSPQLFGDAPKTPENYLWLLFDNSVLRSEIRRIIFDAFKKYLIIVPSREGRLSIRLSSDEREEQGVDQVSMQFYDSATSIEKYSDGVKAFIGIVIALIAGESRITLIDEPEAFLHPTLSAQLGKEISRALAGTNRRLFIATHSASFLMGCFQSGVSINIIRLTYADAVATSRLLSKDKLTTIMKNPLLRSLGVFNALFYSAVVVTEADSDRVFYQEVNERLLAVKDPRGIEGCLFLNAQNKQTIWSIVGPLRELGIPAIGIVDIDVIKEGGDVWNKPMNGAFVPKELIEKFRDERKNIHDTFQYIKKNQGKDMKKNGGISLLLDSEKERCSAFLKDLADYGIFVVPNGELESWLSSQSSQPSKKNWLNSIFEKMGDDPKSEGYIRPTEGDVWDFIGDIKSWVVDPARKGIPN